MVALAERIRFPVNKYTVPVYLIIIGLASYMIWNAVSGQGRRAAVKYDADGNPTEVAPEAVISTLPPQVLSLYENFPLECMWDMVPTIGRLDVESGHRSYVEALDGLIPMPDMTVYMMAQNPITEQVQLHSGGSYKYGNLHDSHDISFTGEIIEFPDQGYVALQTRYDGGATEETETEFSNRWAVMAVNLRPEPPEFISCQ